MDLADVAIKQLMLQAQQQTTNQFHKDKSKPKYILMRRIKNRIARKQRKSQRKKK